MERNIPKKVDGVLNPIFILVQLLSYLVLVPFFAFLFILLDFKLLADVFFITFEKLSHFNTSVFISLCGFLALTCGPIIGIDILVSIFIKNKEANSEYGVVYDFIYELIDNIFRCLSFIGVFYQVVNMSDLNSNINSKISVLILFGLVIGIQQFILKSWFKTIRKFDDTDLVQGINEFLKLRGVKKEIKRLITDVLGIDRTKDPSLLEQKLKDLFITLYNKKETKNTFEKLVKYKPVLDILDNEDMQKYRKILGNKKKSSSNTTTTVLQKLEELKKYM